MFSKSFIIATFVAVLASNATASSPPDCSRPLYEVQGGDACDQICGNNRVSNYQLGLVNPEIDSKCSNLHPGQTLCLGRKGQDCTDVHVVVSGESCWKVATDAGTTIKLLLQNNPNLGQDCQFIRPGEVLCVAKEPIPYTPNPPPNH